MSRDPRVRLSDILTSIDRILEYLADTDFEEFESDPRLQDAVIRRLEIIGEAVKGLSAAERKKEPHIPWREIAGTRDKLIHDYYLVDLQLVWEMVQRHLAPLRQAVLSLLDANDAADQDADGGAT